MVSEQLDITPDPKILIALTHTPLKPLDALCELIDNGIDSFRASALAGIPKKHPLIDILVPGAAEARRGEGVVRVVDNGIGLDREALESTLKAGFTAKNRYDTLGLFGMGFNIATGKLGRRTTVITAREGDSHALKVVIDLPEVVKSKSYLVPVQTIDKPENFTHGTSVEVSNWWHTGDPNAGFARDLASISKTNLRELLGRRYATILRPSEDERIRIFLNGESVEGFEHCVWAETRFVERQGWGMIPARFTFDEVIQAQRRCVNDGTVLDAGRSSCVECGGTTFRTVDERIRGWVGIQRFDDNNKFGIDLVRNGRAIRPMEKDAFFNHVNELNESVKEYPTDQQTGRIVGEVHLDHVPVDFQKQDFQRTSEEWQRAIEFLRGGSLLPSNWKDGTRNETPVSKLFQGYRKVRNYGISDMYMGRFDEATGKAVRISRDIEGDYYNRFLNRETGYYEDTKWWDLVESATVPPILPLEECPECGFQNSPNADTCEGCGRIILSKLCIACKNTIARSAVICPECGSSQIPEVIEPWRCNVCGGTNDVDAENCGTCGCLRGQPNPVDLEVLRELGNHLPQLSFESRSFDLVNGGQTAPVEVLAYQTDTLRPIWNRNPVPTISFRSTSRVEVFIDLAHPHFTRLGVLPEEAISIEAAQYLFNLLSTEHFGHPGFSIQNLSAEILAEVWGEHLAKSPEKLREDIRILSERIAEHLEANELAADFYDELDQFELRELTDRLISEHKLEQLGQLRSSGGYLRYSSPQVLVRFFSWKPDSWFGNVWKDRLPDSDLVGAAAAKDARDELVGTYTRCLEDCAAYLRFAYDDKLIISRTIASLSFLEEKLR